MKLYMWFLVLVCLLPISVFSQTTDVSCTCRDQLNRIEMQQITTSSDLRAYIDMKSNNTDSRLTDEILSLRKYIINDSIDRNKRLTEMIYRETNPYKFTIPMVLGIIFGSSLVLALSTRRR